MASEANAVAAAREKLEEDREALGRIAAPLDTDERSDALAAHGNRRRDRRS
jgi:hypothetical protein